MMIFPLAAIGLLWFILSRTSTATRLMRGFAPDLLPKATSVALVVAALLVLARGNVWAALFLFGISLWLLGRGSGTAGAKNRAQSPRRDPRTRSRLIVMGRDPATGRLQGSVLSGSDTWTPLERLTLAQCVALLETCRRGDPAGASLLEPYLDGRFPGWRAAEEVDGDPRDRRARFTSRMSEDEAYQVLGLPRGATRDEIVRSHRAAMKKWHPDQGGSADLAARANEAKEVLLRRHA